MFDTIKIFTVPFVSAQWSDLSAHISDVISRNEKELWVTANPEIIERSFNDAALRAVLQDRSVVFPDGVGILWASKILGTPLKERLSGIDMIPLFKGLSVYCLGARASVVKKAAAQLGVQGMRVVGAFHGYFDELEERHVLDELKRLRPQVLLVGLGMGRQEKWLADHIEELPINIAVTVGGSFDVISGEKQRASLWVRKVHLEWLYRLCQEPKRLIRQWVLLKFVVRVLIKKFLFCSGRAT